MKLHVSAYIGRFQVSTIFEEESKNCVSPCWWTRPHTVFRLFLKYCGNLKTANIGRNMQFHLQNTSFLNKLCFLLYSLSYSSVCFQTEQQLDTNSNLTFRPFYFRGRKEEETSVMDTQLNWPHCRSRRGEGKNPTIASNSGRLATAKICQYINLETVKAF
jgi:hypothetical protein